MTERPHFRTHNHLRKPNVIIELSDTPLSKDEREAIQYANIPDTTMGRAVLTCYSIDRAERLPDDTGQSPTEITVELPDVRSED